MKRQIMTLTVCSLMAVTLFLACIPTNTKAAIKDPNPPQTEGDLIVFNIDMWYDS